MNYTSEYNFWEYLQVFSKLFIYYPMKYMILLFILIIVYKLIGIAYDFLKKAIKLIYKFGKIFIECMEGDKSCLIKMFGKSFINLFKLFSGILCALLAIVYVVVFIILLILTTLCLIPFNFILPDYHSI